MSQSADPPPNWTYEETLLAYDLYLQHYATPLRHADSRHPAVEALSRDLRELALHPEEARKNPRFRNPAGVARKIQNLMYVATRGVSGSENGSAVDSRVVADYPDSHEVHRLATALRASGLRVEKRKRAADPVGKCRWLVSKRATSSEVPAPVQAVLETLADLTQLPGLRSAEGGIKRDDVVVAVMTRGRLAGLTPAAGSYMDASGAGGSIGLRVEAGRAHTNNDGLLAVIEAARDPHVRALLLLVPATYKGSITSERVADRVDWLLNSPGIELEVLGVAVVPY